MKKEYMQPQTMSLFVYPDLMKVVGDGGSGGNGSNVPSHPAPVRKLGTLYI